MSEVSMSEDSMLPAIEKIRLNYSTYKRRCSCDSLHPKTLDYEVNLLHKNIDWLLGNDDFIGLIDNDLFGYPYTNVCLLCDFNQNDYYGYIKHMNDKRHINTFFNKYQIVVNEIEFMKILNDCYLINVRYRDEISCDPEIVMKHYRSKNGSILNYVTFVVR